MAHIYEVGQRLRLINSSRFRAQCVSSSTPIDHLMFDGFIAEIKLVVRKRNGVFYYVELHFDGHPEYVKFRVDWEGLAFFEKLTEEEIAEENMKQLKEMAEAIRNAPPSWAQQEPLRLELQDELL